MKFTRYIFKLLLVLTMAFSLTACSAKEDVSPIMVKDDNDFATLLIDGSPLTHKNVDGIRLTPFEKSLLYGVTIDLSNLDYTVDYLFDCSMGIRTGDKKYEFFFDEAEYMLDSEEPDEIINDLMFFYYDTSTYAYVQYNDVALSISTLYDSLDTAPIDTIKEDIQALYKCLTFEDISADEEYATAYDFNSVKFDCGWHITNVTKAEKGNNTLSFIYEYDTISMEAGFRIEKAENVEYFLNPENSDMFNLEPLLDKNGNEIGYINLGMQSENYSNYLIRLEDGTYMEVQISGTDSSDATFPHNWESIENILNNGNK